MIFLPYDNHLRKIRNPKQRWPYLARSLPDSCKNVKDGSSNNSLPKNDSNIDVEGSYNRLLEKSLAREIACLYSCGPTVLTRMERVISVGSLPGDEKKE